MDKKAKVPTELKLKEAISRMEYLEFDEELIRQFKEEGTVPLFIHNMDEVYGIRRNKVDRLTAFEKRTHALIYTVIFTPTEFGDMESYLYVSDWEEEWPSDWDDIHEGYAMTWTENLSYPECSEYGTISFIKTESGCLKRIG